MLLHAYRVFYLAAVLCAATAVPNAASQSEIPSSKKPVSLSVHYERSTDRIAVNASRAPLAKVFELVGKQVPIALEAADEELLQSEISTDIPLQPVEEALRALLSDFNTLLFYTEVTDPNTQTAVPMLAAIKVVSKKPEGAGSSGLTVWRAPEEQTHSDPKPNDSIATKYDLAKLFQALKQPSSEKEKQRIIESLIGLLPETAAERDHQAFADILTNLKEHAPDQAVVPLVGLLRQTEENRVFRAMAAMALGEVGNDYAVEPLIGAFHDSDPLVQANAAMGLARLRNERGLQTLLNVFNGDNQSLQQSVATTLAVSGNPQARQALNKLIAAGKLAAETVPPDTTDVPTGK